jgi:hypothetical protein
MTKIIAHWTKNTFWPFLMLIKVKFSDKFIHNFSQWVKTSFFQAKSVNVHLSEDKSSDQSRTSHYRFTTRKIIFCSFFSEMCRKLFSFGHFDHKQMEFNDKNPWTFLYPHLREKSYINDWTPMVNQLQFLLESSQKHKR